MTPVSIDAALLGKIRLGVAEIDGVTVREADAALAAEIEAAGKDFRARHPGASSGDVPGVEDARGLYKAVGLDPTKTRPSNEALLRRVLKGEALYTVNTLVDALNLSSLREQIPFGLYDLDRVEPPVILRRGAAGESYEGIRKGPVNVDARPVLVDARGPFGNPTSDSARTMVTPVTTRALVVVFAPRQIDERHVRVVLEVTAKRMSEFTGGSATFLQ